MKITKIEFDDHMYIVTETPNAIQAFFGMKERKTLLKQAHRLTYANYSDNIGVYRRKDGSVLGATHKITRAIDNWKNRW